MDSLQASQTWPETIQLSDCYQDCLDQGCPFDSLGDGTCNQNCNTDTCGFDGGDCAYCSEGCTLDLLMNEECDQICNNPQCSYDNNTCEGCWSSCDESKIGDGQCDLLCDTIGCQYDGGDCEYDQEKYCNYFCPIYFIGDYICDPDCNNSDCNYDGGDCQGQEVDCTKFCPEQKIGNGICDEYCNYPLCLYDDGDCGCSFGCTQTQLMDPNCNVDDPCDTPECEFKYGVCGDCASGCFEEDISNGVCDQACFNEQCQWDGQDCGCFQSCTSIKTQDGWDFNYDQSYNQDCQTSYCHYNYDPYYTDAQYDYFVETNIFYQILQDVEVGLFQVEKCELQGCSEEDLYYAWENYWCDQYQACHSEECLFCAGYYYGNWYCPDYCYSCSQSECVACWSGYALDYKGDCVQDCGQLYDRIQIWYTGSAYCVPRFDTSTQQNPGIIYVDTGQNNGDGSQNNPYNSLSYAFSMVWEKYTIIYLSSGDFLYFQDEKIYNQQVYDKYSPLSRLEDQDFIKLVIQGTGNETVIYLSEYMKIAPVVKEFYIQDLVISGKYNLDLDCQSQECTYCRYYYEQNGHKMSDQQKILVRDFPENCNEFHGSNIIQASNFLYIENVDFQYIRNQPQTIIFGQNNIYLDQVSFYKVQASASVVYLYSSQNNPSFFYQSGSVSYLNDGYEFNNDQQFPGFFSGFSLQDATFNNVTFEWIVVDSLSSQSQYNPLIYVEEYYGQFKLQNSVFSNILCYNLLLINQQEVEWDDYEPIDRVSSVYSQQHILLSNLVFQDVYSQWDVIYIIFDFNILNVNITDIFF